jgi:SAM-dependent methyltransferase
MLSFLKKKRSELDGWLSQRGLAHTFSLPRYQLHSNISPLIQAHAKSPCLDAGSGRSPLKKLFQAQSLEVVSIDIDDRSGEVDHIADLQEMQVIKSASMQTVICIQVLEHVPRPWDASREIARVLKPGGFLILSVPHLSVIHEAPQDYYRYTSYGLTSLLEPVGLKVKEIHESGGLIGFLAHGLSTVFLCSLGAVPALRWLAWLFNYVLLIQMLRPVDRLIGLKKVYPCNYIVVAQKNQEPRQREQNFERSGPDGGMEGS